MTHSPIPQISGRDPMLIGLCGRAGTGKTEAAEYLVASHRFEQAAFADALKDLLALHFEALGIDYAHLHEQRLKNVPLPGLDFEPGVEGVTARYLMQTLGDWGRAIDPDWWVHALAHRVGLQMEMGPARQPAPVHDRIVISDVRYPNEADWLISRGGVLIRLHRDQAEPVREHSSESHIDALPAHIDLINAGPTLVGFHALLDGALASVGIEA